MMIATASGTKRQGGSAGHHHHHHHSLYQDCCLGGKYWWNGPFQWFSSSSSSSSTTTKSTRYMTVHRVSLSALLVIVIVSLVQQQPRRWNHPSDRTVGAAAIGVASSSTTTTLEQYLEISAKKAATTATTTTNTNTDEDDGWRTIQVFYGKPDLLASLVDRKKLLQQHWFAQSRQDEIVAALLGQKEGLYFIDLAANEAVRFSNTLGLEMNLQWKGLCIEANPIYWRALSFRKCQVVAAVVGAQRFEKIQFQLQGGLGGIVSHDFENAHPRTIVGSIWNWLRSSLSVLRLTRPITTDAQYYTVPLREILLRNRAPAVIDYLSLDVEGAELFVMQSFPWQEYRIKIITIERPTPALQRLLLDHHYVAITVLADYGETLWIHRDFSDALNLNAVREYQTRFTRRWEQQWLIPEAIIQH